MCAGRTRRRGAVADTASEQQPAVFASDSGPRERRATSAAGKTTIVLDRDRRSRSPTSDSNNSSATCPTGETSPTRTNGVLYVPRPTGPAAPVIYTPFTANTSYTTDANCGDAYVPGGYSNSLTIASRQRHHRRRQPLPNSVSLTGNPTPPPTPTGNALLGLVANDFVRVYHPVTTAAPAPSLRRQLRQSGVTNGATRYSNLYIYAAILAVKPLVHRRQLRLRRRRLGTLHIYGALAQLFRGTVGTGGGGGTTTGYVKNYDYDDRLSELEPPYFLEPGGRRPGTCSARPSATSRALLAGPRRRPPRAAALTHSRPA